MVLDTAPEWMSELKAEDLAFIKKFLLASGSLKEMARLYGVTYPTVRLRLDKLIKKIQISDDRLNEPYTALVKRMTEDGRIDPDAANALISGFNAWYGGRESREPPQ